MSDSIDNLWRQVLAAKLADDSQRADWLDPSVPSGAAPYDLVDAWLVQGRLTAYQAQALLEGEGRRLTLGPYQILEPIGQGAMGAVYRARRRGTDQIVALKILRGDRANAAEAISRFRREGNVAARLEHPHIVNAEDAGESEGIHYIAMALAPGQDLGRIVKESGPLPWSLAVDAIAQAARGLAHAHSLGVIHRDVKPGNLHLGDDGVVRVLDLGLASLRDVDQSLVTGPGRMMGTIDFMSPEQGRDAANADERSDIYSLGVTLWAIATDTSPFAGTFLERLQAHRTAPRPDLSSVCPDAPQSLSDYLKRMMAIDPNERPRTMAEVARTLARWTDHPPPDDVAADEPTADSRVENPPTETPPPSEEPPRQEPAVARTPNPSPPITEPLAAAESSPSSQFMVWGTIAIAGLAVAILVWWVWLR